MKYKVKFNIYFFDENHYPYIEQKNTITINALSYDNCRDRVLTLYPKAENIVIDAMDDDPPNSGNSPEQAKYGNSLDEHSGYSGNSFTIKPKRISHNKINITE